MKLKNTKDGTCIELHGDWEVVQDHRWVDVTEDCTLESDTDDVLRVMHENSARFVTAWHGQGYRLLKIKDSQSLCHSSYFIIEKKVSE